MKTIYNIVSQDKSTFLSEPTLDRNFARSKKQALKQQGVDAIIITSKLDRQQAVAVR